MRLIVEMDGVVFDIEAAWFSAHELATQAVGWSRLDRATFWRLIRTKGRDANVLPAAKPVKIREYWDCFDRALETEGIIAKCALHEQIREVLISWIGRDRSFSRDRTAYSSADQRKRPDAEEVSLECVTLGTNVRARRKLVEVLGFGQVSDRVRGVNPDPKRRQSELRALAAPDPRTILIASSDVLVRSGENAEVFCVGISSGSCTASRLHQAGARVVYGELSELADSLAGGGHDLVQHGLLPRSLG